MKLPLLFIAISLVGCSSIPKTHTETPSLKYAKSGVVDAKDFNRKAMQSSDEIDDLVKQLLKESSE